MHFFYLCEKISKAAYSRNVEFCELVFLSIKAELAARVLKYFVHFTQLTQLFKNQKRRAQG